MEYQDCLFEYYKKCAADESDALAKIMLTESANLGSKDAAREMRKLGLEIRPLVRYERKIVKSLKNQIYEYSGVDMNRPKPQKKKKDKDEISKYLPEKTLDDYAIDIMIYGGLGFAGLFVLFILFFGALKILGIESPIADSPPTHEQRESSLYSQLSSAKDRRDHALRKAHQYMDKNNSGMAWEWTKAAEEHQAVVDSIRNKINNLQRQQNE